MKTIALTAILFLMTSDLMGSQVVVGIFTDDITIWRYWEKTEMGYERKIFVFNTSDSTIKFSLKQAVFRGHQMNIDTTKNKVFIQAVEIAGMDYMIFDYPQSTEDNEFMEFFVNDEAVGILDLYNYSPPVTIPAKKYISNEGLNGRGDEEYWISKNHLITHDHQVDTIVFHFNYFERNVFIRDGILIMHLKPSFNFKEFEVIHERDLRGGFDLHNTYTIEIPVNAQAEKMTRKDVMVIFKAIKLNDVSLGLYTASGFNFLKKDESMEELRKRVRLDIYYELPIIIQ